MNDTIFNRLVNHIQSKGIIVSNIKRLSKNITDSNYNRVIKPYLKLISDEDIRSLSITTDDLLNLYKLDKKISLIFLDHILEIEKKLNTQIAYTIEDSFRIFDGCLFKFDRKFVQDRIFNNTHNKLSNLTFDQLISKMTKYAHINPNTNTYENISKNNLFKKWEACPLDALCLTWTFSTTVLTYLSLNDHLKSKVVKIFKLNLKKTENFDYLINKILSLRNIITHNNVLIGSLLDLQDEPMIYSYNQIFFKNKIYLDFYDFVNMLEFLSGIDTRDELREVIEKYQFTPRVKTLVDKLLKGVGRNAKTIENY